MAFTITDKTEISTGITMATNQAFFELTNKDADDGLTQSIRIEFTDAEMVEHLRNCLRVTQQQAEANERMKGDLNNG